MEFRCSVDNTICGSGHSGPCLAVHPDRCVAKYIETPKLKRRKPKKQREEYYEEDKEEWI